MKIGVAFARGRKQLSRQDFCEQLRRILAEQFPDETEERVTIAAVVPARFAPCCRANCPMPSRAA